MKITQASLRISDKATQSAVLNARYVSHALADEFDKPFEADCMHEAIFSHKKLVIDARHTSRIGRLDEATAARKPVLRWKKDMETLSKTA